VSTTNVVYMARKVLHPERLPDVTQIRTARIVAVGPPKYTTKDLWESNWVAIGRSFLGESSEERRARRRQALLEAALDQIWEEGLQATSVRSICSRAGLISRYFYESFDNLDELMSAALSETADELLAAGTRAVRDVDQEPRLERVRRGLDAAVGVLVSDPRKSALMAALGAGDARLQRERRGMVIQVAEAIRSDAELSGLNETDARPTTLYLAGGLVELTLAFLDGDLSLSRSQLVDQLAAMTLGALDGQTEYRRHRKSLAGKRR